MDAGANDAREQLERCQQAVAERPDSTTAHLNLATALLRLGRMGEAEDALRRALEIDPDSPEALVNLGGIRLARWDFRGCVEVNRRASAAKPSFLLAHYNEGLGHLYLGEAADVVRCFRRVVEIDGAHAGGHYYLAVGLLAVGEVRESRKHLDEAVQGKFSPQPEFLKALEKAEAGLAPSPKAGG
jgi:tetratricopeptide (TPR) repeat protein